MGRRRIRRQAERAAYKSEEEGARTALTERGYKSGRLRAERRQSAVATGGRTAEGRGTDAQQRVPTKAPRPSCGGRFGAKDPPYMFLRNEPTDFSNDFLRITSIVKNLCRLQSRFAGGFVLENEPTGRVFLRGLYRKVGTF